MPNGTKLCRWCLAPACWSTRCGWLCDECSMHWLRGGRVPVVLRPDSEPVALEAAQVLRHRCEACEGTGLVSDCNVCDEPTGLPSLELFGGICGMCAALKEVGT